MTIVRNFSAALRRAGRLDWEGELEGGKGGSFVEQDKGPAVRCGIFAGFSKRTHRLSPSGGVMSSTMYSTAENAAGSLVQRGRFQHLEGARGPIGVAATITIAAALLIAFGHAFGVLISNTDSAAPAGLYRVVSDKFQRGELVAACLPIAIAQEGLARGYLRTGACAGNAEPVGKIIGALPGDLVEIEPRWVSVNDTRFERSAVATRDSDGRPLPHVTWGSHRVASGQVWLFGFNNGRSWDSRYFGAIPLANVRGQIKPIFVW
jgi:conjugative transfer signal peptidase TraF